MRLTNTLAAAATWSARSALGVPTDNAVSPTSAALLSNGPHSSKPPSFFSTENRISVAQEFSDSNGQELGQVFQNQQKGMNKEWRINWPVNLARCKKARDNFFQAILEAASNNPNAYWQPGALEWWSEYQEKLLPLVYSLSRDWGLPPLSDGFLAEVFAHLEFGVIRIFAEVVPIPPEIFKLADIVDESETYGTGGASHLLMWALNWMAQELADEETVTGLAREWDDACARKASTLAPPNSTLYTLSSDASETSLCEAAAERLEKSFLPAISVDGHPWQDGVLDWWRANQTTLLPIALKLMDDSKNDAEEALRFIPLSFEDRDQELKDIIGPDEMDCAEGHFSENFVTACSERHYLMRSVFEANIPGLWGAYHFVDRLVSWLTIHDIEVFNTPGLAACFIRKRFGDTIAAEGLASPTTVKAGRDKSSCTKANKKLKNSLNSVTENKNFLWQPAVRPWWEQHHQELLAQIAIVHVVASDDFDEYVKMVVESPDIPDTSKDASYFAAQRIYQAVNDSKIYGQWGAYHLVSRVSKWMMINPDGVNKWEKACSGALSEEPCGPVRAVPPSHPGELDLVLGGHLNHSSLLRQPETSNAAPARSFALWNLVFDVFR